MDAPFVLLVILKVIHQIQNFQSKDLFASSHSKVKSHLYVGIMSLTPKHSIISLVDGECCEKCASSN